MILQVGVKVLLQNKAGKYLLVKRSSKKYGTTSGSWDIPGGRINPGTSLVDNLMREVFEEVGLTIDTEVRLLDAQDIFTADGEKHVVRLTYLGKTLTEQVKLDISENTDYKWLTYSQLIKQKDQDVYLTRILKSNKLT